MSRGRILIAGAVANKAGQGGEAWVRLSWVLGFRKLGFDVMFLEQLQSGAPPGAVDFFHNTMKRHGLLECATLLDGEKAVCGPPLARAIAFAEEADALINISGHLRHPEHEGLFEKVRRRVYVDIDPGYTQIWHSQGASLGLENHDAHFTIGANIGTPECTIPTCGFTWRKVLPPVLLDEWPPVKYARFDRFSTIANWRGSYGQIEMSGTTYGLKVHEFRKFIDLPRQAGLPFEIALNIHPADQKDLVALQRAGWCIADPVASAGTPDGFREYVQHSGAEFSVAQGVYAHTNSGWFSDRTAHYLASGRPALVQETGFSQNLPTGTGLIGFRTMEEAVAGAQSIVDHYEEHVLAARSIAESHFDSNIVLRQFCKDAGIVI
jgi:hypothetical protein